MLIHCCVLLDFLCESFFDSRCIPGKTWCPILSAKHRLRISKTKSKLYLNAQQGTSSSVPLTRYNYIINHAGCDLCGMWHVWGRREFHTGFAWGKPEESRVFGKPSRRSEDNGKMYLKEI